MFLYFNIKFPILKVDVHNFFEGEFLAHPKNVQRISACTYIPTTQ